MLEEEEKKSDKHGKHPTMHDFGRPGINCQIKIDMIAGGQQGIAARCTTRSLAIVPAELRCRAQAPIGWCLRYRYQIGWLLPEPAEIPVSEIVQLMCGHKLGTSE